MSRIAKYGLKTIFVKEVPLNSVFRYHKAYYKRVSKDMARNMDWESGDYIDLTPDVLFDACAVPIAQKEGWF